ncbi:ATP-dependent endonuclease [Micromonospora sp. NPDC005254]|uniref:ATP-dependent nuclease n=1 Tax=Micromonospora sp. NPDC005254 TaxID=3364229 RepID=UPI00367C83A8
MDVESGVNLDDETRISGERVPKSLVSPPPASTKAAPHIRRVWFRNFKGFEEFEVRLGRFNVLAGANNAGKSTLLQGIDLFYSLLKVHASGDRVRDRGKLLNPAILPVATPRDLFYHGITRRGNANVPAIVGAEFDNGTKIEFGVRSIFGSINSKIESQERANDEILSALLAQPAVWVPSSVGIVRDEEYRTAARQRGLISAGRHNEVLRNLLVLLSQESPDRFDQLQEILSQRFNARLTGVEFDGAFDQFVSADYADDDGTRHDLYSAGAGFVQVVQMLAFILTRDASVLLLDEPDAHLHSALQRVVVEILDEVAGTQQFQVVLSTHSKEIINFVDPSRLILIESGAQAAEAATYAVTPVTILKSLGAIDNVDAYALVSNRKCLFVEGTTDQAILGRFAATLEIRALTGDDRVVIVQTGGSDSEGHLQQLDVLEGVLGVNLSTLQIKDRDGRLAEYRNAQMTEAKRPLHIFERDCIESYLVEPSVLRRVIEDVCRERGAPVSISNDDILNIIENVCDDLRTPATDRIAQRYIGDEFTRNNRRAGVAEANSRAREVMEAAWPTLETRLSVLPGKTLLSKIRQVVQSTFGASFGNERLAEAFKREDIPSEITEILKAVADLRGDSPPSRNMHLPTQSPRTGSC